MSADGKLEWRLLGETGGTLLLVAAKSAFQRFLQLAGDFAGRGLHRTLHDVAGFGERLVECFFDCRLADSREVMGCRDENREKGMTGWLDAHPHYVTEHYAKECRAAGHAHPDGMPGLPDWSVAAALDVMGRAGIGTAVLSVSSPGVHLGNDSLAESRAARDLARHVNDAGAKIVASHPAGDELPRPLPHRPAFAPVLADMDARAAVVTLHPTSSPGAELTTFGRPAR